MDIAWTNTRVKLGDLQPWSLNPRQSSKTQARRLLKSWERFGQVQTIAIGPSGEVYDGHQRLSALLTVHGPGYVVDARQSSVPLSDQERRELVATLHAGAVGSWDWDVLSSWSAGDLMDWGFDAATLADWKRDVGALGNLIESEKVEADAEPQIDRADELREKWGTERGQLWCIGAHRLLCGDSLEEHDRLTSDGIDLTLTDPPYGINVVGTAATVGGGKPVTIGSIRGRRKDTFGGVKNMGVGSDGADHWVDAGVYRPVFGDDKPFEPAWLLDLPGEKIIFGGNYFASKMPDSRCWIVWDKNNTGNFADAELAWSSFTTGVRLYRHTWNGLVREGERRLEGEKRIHPTQKPVGLFMQILADYSEEGDVIFDPYLGSGVTMLACEQTSRKCAGVEIDPAYCAVVLERMATAFPGIEIERMD